MANKNTKHNRVAVGYKSRRGACINSTEARKAQGRKPYWAPTRKERGDR